MVSEVGKTDPWSVVYKMQCGKMKTEKVLSTIETEQGETKDMDKTFKKLCKKMFPKDNKEDDTEEHARMRNEAELESNGIEDDVVNEAEVYTCLSEMKNGKAPGQDDIEVKLVKEAWNVIGGEITCIIGECIKRGMFPQDWKIGKLVILLKNGKPPSDVGSYRPITLLSVIGKVLEKMVVRKLRTWMSREQAISERQYGFVPGKGTSDALCELKRKVQMSSKKYVAGVFVDIKGAFDNAWPPLLLEVLREYRCPKNLYRMVKDYLAGRCIKIGKVFERFVWEIEKGCPQGSVIGPIIWILILQDWLRKEFGEGIYIIAYADDIVILVESDREREIERKINEVLEDLKSWLRRAKLEWSPQKTKGVLLKGGVQHVEGEGCIRRRVEWRPKIFLGDEELEWVPCLQYLGVWIDESWLFEKHTKLATVKAKTIMLKMRNVNRATWGVGFNVMNTIYEGAFLPIIMYGASIWYDRVEQSHVKRDLRASQRTALLAATASYQTTSWAALVATCGKLPIERMVRIRGKVEGMRERMGRENVERKVKRERLRNFEREQLEIEWNEWKNEFREAEFDRKIGRYKNERIKNLIVDVKKWAQTKRVVDRWALGYLTGHIGVRKYLFEHQKCETEKCECGEVETVDHVVWDCKIYETERRCMKERMGNVENPRDINDKKIYEAIRKGFRKMMEKKEEREKEQME